jgi:spore coat polysaccharide biosynthesis protein SpsF (cytidylyltransferase family)
LTNVFPRSFPIGMSVEIINSKFFLKKKIFIKDKISKEHITTYFYKNEKKIFITTKIIKTLARLI